MKEIIFWLLGLIGVGIVAQQVTNFIDSDSDTDKQHTRKEAGNFQKKDNNDSATQ